MLEEYTIIKEHPNYAISNHGNILNITTQRIMKQTTCSKGYKVLCLNGKVKKVHILLGEAFIDNPENKPFIDHIDGDGTNNELSNLRWATRPENGQNRRRNVNNTSGVKGVVLHKHSNKWRAIITHNNKQYSLGYYDTVEDAKTARQAVANILFKEYTNAIEKQEIEINLNLSGVVKSKRALIKLNLI